MDEKLILAIETIFNSLTTVWTDNGNILADAVRDLTITNLSKILNKPFEEIESIIQQLVDTAQ